MPVDVTTARARPRVMPVPAKTIERLSASGVVLGQRRDVLLDRQGLAGERRLVDLDPPRVEQAGVRRHRIALAQTTTSPVTSSSAGISCSRPSRTTLA